MKIIATEFGQVLQLVVMEEVRPLHPRSALYTPDVIDAVAKHYQFVTRPTDIQQAVEKGAKFQIGKALIDDVEIAILELGLYNDGIIVITRDTRHSDMVMDDFAQWAISRFNLRAPQTKIVRQYTSTVAVEFEPSVDEALKKFDSIKRAFADALKNNYGWDTPPLVSRLGFAVDPAMIPPQRNGLFHIERRAGVPFAANRWFSGAPLRTDQHLALLKAFERELASN